MVAFAKFLRYFRIEVVVSVLGLPITQRHTQLVQQRTVNGDIGFGGSFERVFSQKKSGLVACPRL